MNLTLRYNKIDSVYQISLMLLIEILKPETTIVQNTTTEIVTYTFGNRLVPEGTADYYSYYGAISPMFLIFVF